MNINYQDAILLALAQIPAGRVTTYGGLAASAGIVNGARLVGKVLRELPKDTRLPWHRVINAQGRISLPDESPSFLLQQERLMGEGIVFNNGTINLKRFGC